MKTYIGCKIIRAEPMSELDFAEAEEKWRWEYSGKNRAGYKVIYRDGHVSWSPKETFEAAYREITFGEAELVTKAHVNKAGPEAEYEKWIQAYLERLKTMFSQRNKF